MSDSLRDRIAAVLRAHFPGFNFHCGTAAHKVIAELGLRHESGNDFAYGWQCPVCAGGMRYDHGRCNQTPPVNLIRYVTDWEADDE